MYACFVVSVICSHVCLYCCFSKM